MPYRDPLRGNARRDYYARINENAPRGPDGVIPLGKDEPPPGYTDFYGWHEGRFYGLRGITGSLLQRLRKEGRWFDEYGDEFPRWDARGRPLSPFYSNSPLNTYHCDEWQDVNYQQQRYRNFAPLILLQMFLPYLALAAVFIIAWIASSH